MKKVIVSLVSEQTAPNIYLIKNYFNKETESFVFLNTEEMWFKSILDNMIRSLNLPQDKIKEKIVPSDDPVGVQSVLDSFGFNFTDNFHIVNVTGGTKIMALVTNNYFANKNNRLICYLPFGKTRYQTLYGDDEVKISSYLTLRENLTSYGIKVISRKEPLKSREFNQKFKEELLCKYREKGVMQKLNTIGKSTVSGKKAHSKFLEYDRQLKLDIIAKFPDDGALDYNTAKGSLYLESGWFEEYVYQSLTGIGCVKRSDIFLNVKVDKDGADNEIDVLFIYKNSLHAIECKTRKKASGNTLISDTFDKQKALSSKLGLSAKMYLFTLAETTEKQYKKANSLENIEIINRKKLESTKNFADLFGDLFKG